MPSKSLSFAKLLGSDNKLSTDTFSDNVSTIEQASNTDVLTNLGNAVGDQRLVGSNLYIWNGTGWYRIALINQTPTWDSGGQPSTSYELDADSPQDATIIVLAASDPDGLPIVYSYVTSGSMDSMATISQDSSVFTITPKTVTEVGGAVELTGSITFRASDGINILPSVSSFTLNFITIIENSKYTTLLATAVDTSDNNNITDSSTNNQTITVTGDVHAGTFSPYRHGGYSTYFDGSGDSLAIADDASLEFGSDNFTLEMWYKGSDTDQYATLTAKGTTVFSSGNWSLMLNHTVTGDIAFYVYEYSVSAPILITGDVHSSDNNWTHIAVVRSGSSWNLYVNGTSQANRTSSITLANSSANLGIGADLYYGRNLAGYISDYRIVNGAALYTSAFTPPTERLTAVTNTSLLTCHLPYIADGSSNGHSITINGNTSTKPFGPYDYNEYEAADHGGSVYFDGTGDLLTITNDAALDFGTGDFTIEAWVYNTGTDYFSIWQNAPVLTTTDTSRAFFGIQATNGSVSFARHAGGGSIVTSSNVAPKNQWNHVVLVRDSTSVRIYVNGVEEASTTDTALTSYGFGQHTITVGYRITPNYGQGYISDLKTVKGTALYTANFTPPTVPLTATSGTGLLLSGTDASIIDKSQTSNLQLVGNTTGSTTQVKFADTKSMYFDGNADEIAYTVPTLSGDFTFEAFIYPESQIQSFPICFTSVWDATVGNRIVLSYDTSTDVDKFSCRVGSNFIVPSSTSSTGQWYHVAVVRSGSTVSMYIDGIRIGTQTYSGSISSRTGYIGGNISNSTGGAFKGYIQDFRFTKGLARYTADFTPPTKPLKG